MSHAFRESPTNPVLPALRSGPGGRSALLGGLAFVEGATTGWGLWELVGWFDQHLLGAGFLPLMPPTVREAGLGSVPLLPDAVRPTSDPSTELPEVLGLARQRTVAAMHAFLQRDDAFLHRAIYAGRVSRRSVDGQPAWVPSPRPLDPLGDLVLSLFAADVLTHREFHEEALCVCERCGRISYHPPATGRSGCREHPTATTRSRVVRRDPAS